MYFEVTKYDAGTRPHPPDFLNNSSLICTPNNNSGGQHCQRQALARSRVQPGEAGFFPPVEPERGHELRYRRRRARPCEQHDVVLSIAVGLTVRLVSWPALQRAVIMHRKRQIRRCTGSANSFVTHGVVSCRAVSCRVVDDMIGSSTAQPRLTNLKTKKEHRPLKNNKRQQSY